jgi:hypothetical protein
LALYFGFSAYHCLSCSSHDNYHYFASGASLKVSVQTFVVSLLSKVGYLR